MNSWPQHLRENYKRVEKNLRRLGVSLQNTETEETMNLDERISAILHKALDTSSTDRYIPKPGKKNDPLLNHLNNKDTVPMGLTKNLAFAIALEQLGVKVHDVMESRSPKISSDRDGNWRS
jgi:hypothetical protein